MTSIDQSEASIQYLGQKRVEAELEARLGRHGEAGGHKASVEGAETARGVQLGHSVPGQSEARIDLSRSEASIGDNSQLEANVDNMY